MAKPNPLFDLEYQYQLYLQRMAINEATMHEQQKIQVRQAFYGAIGQILILQRDETSVLPENEAIAVFERWIAQIDKFWQEDLKRHQGTKRLN